MFILSKIQGLSLVSSLVEMILVWIGSLPEGSWSIIETSNSPKKAIAIDLGIGVADICRMWGELNCLKKALCLTQNLCCSSMMTYWRFWKSIPSCRSAWVQIMTWIAHDLRSDLILSFWDFVKEPVMHSTLIPRGRRNFAMVR